MAGEDSLSRLLGQVIDPVDEPRQEQVSSVRRLQHFFCRLGEARQVTLVLDCGEECRVRRKSIQGSAKRRRPGRVTATVKARQMR